MTTPTKSENQTSSMMIVFVVVVIVAIILALVFFNTGNGNQNPPVQGTSGVISTDDDTEGTQPNFITTSTSGSPSAPEATVEVTVDTGD